MKTLNVSIVIPVYNEASQLAACLNAIAQQTVRPLEVIVVDNNSTDGTDSIAKTFDFVRLLREPVQGIVYARNRGFDAARGDIIGRIDADTILPPTWIEKVQSVYAEIGAPKLLAVTAPSNFRNFPNSVWKTMHRFTYFGPSRVLLGHSTLVGSNMFMTRKAWLEVRGSTCLRTDLHEDMDLAFHLGAAGISIVFRDDMLASVLARKMFRRSFSYPMMTLRTWLVSHQENLYAESA